MSQSKKTLPKPTKKEVQRFADLLVTYQKDSNVNLGGGMPRRRPLN